MDPKGQLPPRVVPQFRAPRPGASALTANPRDLVELGAPERGKGIAGAAGTARQPDCSVVRPMAGKLIHQHQRFMPKEETEEPCCFIRIKREAMGIPLGSLKLSEGPASFLSQFPGRISLSLSPLAEELERRRLPESPNTDPLPTGAPPFLLPVSISGIPMEFTAPPIAPFTSQYLLLPRSPAVCLQRQISLVPSARAEPLRAQGMPGAPEGPTRSSRWPQRRLGPLLSARTGAGGALLGAPAVLAQQRGSLSIPELSARPGSAA